MSLDLHSGGVGRVATVMTTLVLAAGCASSANPSRPPPSGASANPSRQPPLEASANPSTMLEASPSPVRSAGTIDVGTLTGRIVFDNYDDIWSVNADGTDLTRLTDAPWHEFDPALSPDGRRIAYRSEPNDHPELWVMNADGSGKKRLADGGFPVWSRDGSTIAYAYGGPPSWIATMKADGSGQHRVPNTNEGEYPSLSPDAKRIAFSNNLAGHPLMYIVDVDGSDLVDLSSVGEGYQVDWSPDGRSILFASSRDQVGPGSRDIYVMRPDGSAVQRLTQNQGYTPAWSPSGSYIVYSAGGLFLMRADGSGVTSLPVRGVGETSFPDWCCEAVPGA